MFTNIVQKLKISAIVIFTIGIVLAFISLICTFEFGAAFLIVALISFFSMWFTSLLVYAFAELLEHTEDTSTLTNMQRKLNAQLLEYTKAIRENTSNLTITQRELTKLLEHTKAIRENTSKPIIAQEKLTNEQVSNQEEL